MADQDDREGESGAPSRRQFLGQAGLTTVTLAAPTKEGDAVFKATGRTEAGGAAALGPLAS